MIYRTLKRNTQKIIFSAAVVLYIITAWNSHGFYHADEHYQLIEFAGLKLGTNTPSELPWEYNEQMRPATQVFICYAIFLIINFLGISDPYQMAFVLRLFSALLALAVIRFFIKSTENQLKSESTKNHFRLLSYFVWFIPFISVRFSSETWSGLLFLLALAVLQSENTTKYKPFLFGLILGFSFLFRYQIGFMIAGLGIWLLIIKRADFQFIIKSLAGFLLALLAGCLADFWFYGELVFTPWNYLRVNIIEDAASQFGVSPWNFYMLKLIQLPGLYFGYLIAGAFAIMLVFNPRNIYLWCIFPFFIVHSIIPHKEERFLFPMVFLIPIILVQAYELIFKFLKIKFLRIAFQLGLIMVLIPVNLTGLAAMAQKPAGFGRMGISKYIHDRHKNEKIHLIFTAWANPYNPWQGGAIKFYREKQYSERQIQSLCELNDSIYVKDAVNFLVIRQADLDKKECLEQIEQEHFKYQTQSIPQWQVEINKDYKGIEPFNVLILYQLEKSEVAVK